MIQAKGATAVLTETDMVACELLLLRESMSPVSVVSRDHPFIPAAGLTDASSAGGSSTSTAGCAQEASQSPVAFSLQPKRPFEGCHARFRNSKQSPLGSGDSTCLLSPPQPRSPGGIPTGQR